MDLLMGIAGALAILAIAVAVGRAVLLIHFRAGHRTDCTTCRRVRRLFTDVRP